MKNSTHTTLTPPTPSSGVGGVIILLYSPDCACRVTHFCLPVYSQYIWLLFLTQFQEPPPLPSAAATTCAYCGVGGVMHISPYFISMASGLHLHNSSSALCPLRICLVDEEKHKKHCCRYMCIMNNSNEQNVQKMLKK